MTMKPDATTECSNCGSSDPWLLHHARLRCVYRRLCTSCLLKLHPASYCPTCFHVYDRLSPPPTQDPLVCLKCSSVTHSHCVSPHVPAPYLCPPCANPNLPLFHENRRPIDKKSARVLLAAAQIASVSMRKAALAARGEAEKRVKEAALNRKRAREALEHVATIAAKQKERRNQHRVEGMDSSCGVPVPVPVSALSSKEKERLQGFRAQNTVSVGMECLNVQNYTNVNEKARSRDLVHLLNHNAQGEKVSNGLVSVPSVGVPLLLNSNGRKEDMDSQ